MNNTIENTFVAKLAGSDVLLIVELKDKNKASIVVEQSKLIKVF